MGERMTAVWQLLSLVYVFTIFPFVVAIGLIGGFVFMVLGVLKRLIYNSGPSSADGFLSKWSLKLYMWPIDQLKWIITGDGSFRFLP